MRKAEFTLTFEIKAIVLECLEEAKRSISKGWCKYCYAELPGGKRTAERDPYAVKWCLLGAVKKTVTGRYLDIVLQLLRAKIDKMCPQEPLMPDTTMVTKFNDHSENTDRILDLLDITIKEVKET